MKVKLASTAGFCMGVRRAMEVTLEAANHSQGPLYTFGPLIHNRQVMDLLERKGIRTVYDLGRFSKGEIVIRAHGIPPDQRRLLKESGLKIIDGTCPRVARVQAIIRYHSKKGRAAIIVGDREHAEVIGLMGYAHGPVYVIGSEEEVADLPKGLSYFVAAQTTQDEKTYDNITRAILDRFPETEIFNTICDATHQRQEEVRALARLVDGMVVVGGFHSGNTRRLVQIAQDEGLLTFHVETERDLDPKDLSGMETVGVTAGASTPNWLIKNVVKKIETIQDQQRKAIIDWGKQLFKFLLLSNMVIAAGAGALSYTCFLLSGRTPKLAYPVVAFLYIYAMHVLNRFLDKGTSAYNDPEKAAFYDRHTLFLCLTGPTAISLALLIAYQLGLTIFLALCGFSLLGVLYSVPLLPAQTQQKYPYAKIKDIPGSKTLSQSLAWVAVISLLPKLAGEFRSWPTFLTISLLVLSFSYARSAFLDILQFQGDLIVGKETLPLSIGISKASFIIKTALVLAGIILLVGPFFEWITTVSYPLMLCISGMYLCLTAYEKQWIYPGLSLEALVECNFLLIGAVAGIWQAFS
ncbi:MAG: 4-hydroxy-3-methylbut-2-enyl diphosphate reductase [Deltaproteobacteria bacterium]